MVTRPTLSDDDRAQLVLVGSVAIAFIIISLVVVFNTVLFTNNLAARGSVEEVEDASTFQQQVERELPDLVRHVENGTTSNGDLTGNVDDNVTGVYSELLAESYADTSPKYADVRFNASSTVNGTRVVQEDGGTFENVSGEEDWNPVNSSDPRNVSEFVMVTNSTLNNVSGDNFTAVIEDQRGATITLDMYSGSTDLVLTQSRNGSLENTCAVTGTDGTVAVNVSDGAVVGDTTCPIASLDSMTAPYSIVFEDGNNIRGNYTFLVNGTLSRNDYGDRDGPGNPYANRVVLEAGVDLYFESRTVAYESNQTVTVREGPQ